MKNSSKCTIVCCPGDGSWKIESATAHAYARKLLINESQEEWRTRQAQSTKPLPQDFSDKSERYLN